jgi:ParB family chromosome partitioning protein
MSPKAAELQEIRVDLIDRNPENPRILFRSGELDQLLESIRQYGVQVPVSVYKEGKRYVLIDGERRWRCSVKLNRDTIPALVQEKPAPLTNLLLMFNIHALREQWDLLTIALKLPRVIKLLTNQNGAPPNERQLASQTGLSLGIIRRCKLLLDLPDAHKDTILEELKKPKREQKLTEDFFIEMERALKTVERAMPQALRDKEATRQVLIQKYRAGVIPNIVQFRLVPKIARAGKVSADPAAAAGALRKLFTANSFGIEAAYHASVSEAYTERDLLVRLEALETRLADLRPNQVDDQLRTRLKQLLDVVRRLLEAHA